MGKRLTNVGALILVTAVLVIAAHFAPASAHSGPHEVRIVQTMDVKDDDRFDEDEFAKSTMSRDVFINRRHTLDKEVSTVCASEVRGALDVRVIDTTSSTIVVSMRLDLYQADAGGCGLNDNEGFDSEVITLAKGQTRSVVLRVINPESFDNSEATARITITNNAF